MFHRGCAQPKRLKTTALNKWSRIQESVRFLKDKQASNKKIVLAEHVAALGCTKVGEKKYEPTTLVRAFEYFALSRTSYRQFRDDFELPRISTLTRLTSAIKNLDDNDYLHNMFFCLRDVRKKIAFYCWMKFMLNLLCNTMVVLSLEKQ